MASGHISEKSSDAGSTRCISEPEVKSSGTDSLNSLITNNKGSDCVDTCLNVECSITNQCYGEESSKSKRRKLVCCDTVGQCVWGVLLLIVAISGFIFTPLDLMLWEKLNMRPGLPPYEWWADPPDEVKLRVYVFNVTNHERFMKGLDKKINVEEIGPIVYLEKLLHKNITFNENSTITYVAERFPIYLPEENHVDLNSTIVIPNMALLGMSSYLHSASFLVRTGFRMFASSCGSQFFLKRTIQEYLWDYREKLLDTSRNLVPGIVPVNNLGILARIYADFIDQLTVKIGPQWGHQNFFKIDNFEGESQIPGYDPYKCPDRIVGSTEGVMYQQHLTKQDVLLYWRKTVCKIMPLYFESEMSVASVPVYRYNLSEVVFDRVSNTTDCYSTEPPLPSGLSDASKCYYNFPVVASYPHFYTGQPRHDLYVTGYKPDRLKHNSFVLVEPLTGTPFHSVARMQSNLRIHDLSDFGGDYVKFSNLVLPMFWAEYNQESLPSQIRNTIYFMKVILPPASIIILTLCFLLGTYLISKQLYKHKIKHHSLYTLLRYRRKSKSNLSKNKMYSFETDKFISTGQHVSM